MLSSIGAHLSFPNNPGYQVSKAGLESMARSISYDLGSKKQTPAVGAAFNII